MSHFSTNSSTHPSSTHPSTQSSSSSNPFIRIPNTIITHSLLRNKCILPLYLYSAVNSNKYYNNIVDTNLSLISETFAPSNPSIPNKFKESFNYLSSEVSDSDIPGFSPSFQAVKPNFILASKTTRMQYTFLDYNIKMDNSWTLFYFDEYYYLLEQFELNPKLNIIELLNLYTYLKQRITFYKNISPFKHFSMHESITTITQNTNLSRNTLTKYLNQLVSLGLIEIKKGTFKNLNSTKETNDYRLSNLWLKKYKP